MTESSLLGASTGALLGDTPSRDYASKLSTFNAFAEPELRGVIGELRVASGMHVLDAGCGTGEALSWLREMIEPNGTVVGVDLSTAHLEAARRHLRPGVTILNSDLLEAPFPAQRFDFIWCANTIHHLRDPLRGLIRLISLLRSGGRIALGQSSLLPDMYFAWDSRLERLTNEAVRQYYRDRYSLDERDLASVRAIVGLLRSANLQNVRTRTVLIERISPVDTATERHLRETIFRQTWGERLRPYLSDDDYAELVRLCDPQGPQFALRRPDFHFLQSFTLVTGEV